MAQHIKVEPSNTSIQWVCRKLFDLIKVRGRFDQFAGHVELEDRVEDSACEVTIEAASVNTGLGIRDKDLRKAHFLDVASFSRIAFVSETVTQKDDCLVVTGTLTVKGVSRTIELTVRESAGGFQATTTLNRRDFGMTHAPGFLIGNLITLEATLTL